jgi:hypothetical protein
VSVAATEAAEGFFESNLPDFVVQSGKLVGYGTDDAISSSLANLVPKRGWYDVVIHGTDDGLAFTMNQAKLLPSELYTKMLTDGYQQGQRIRLLSCNAA